MQQLSRLAALPVVNSVVRRDRISKLGEDEPSSWTDVEANALKEVADGGGTAARCWAKMLGQYDCSGRDVLCTHIPGVKQLSFFT